ncbi:MAG TPA: alpha/beta fold hydrolase [Alphaproteobacteria bacterium]|jgi:polyhydroxyalkanoate synthase|nr:alpha/beta fold hydrolase [Alphaproteobacteria bacterium]
MPDPGPKSPLWPGLPDDLAAALAKFDTAAVARAVDGATMQAAREFADGIEAYRHHPYERAAEDARVVWRAGGTALIDHGGDGVPALFAPSLVNRGWVLDLVPGHGMLSWLAGRGIHPYRVEWGSPGDGERDFDIAAYVGERLEPALAEVARRSGRRPVLAGYCMGGLLALAAAIRKPDAIAGLVLLATPWDFHAENAARSAAIGTLYQAARPLFAMLGEFPIDAIQALFATHDPIVALRKFRRFTSFDPASAEARNFVALEDWLNDGVPLTLPVADEAMRGWYGENVTAQGAWSVGGVAMDLGVLDMPSLVVVPGGDRLVPPASAAAVLSGLRHAQRLDIPLGHIGMVVGRRAERELWAPLADWIRGSVQVIRS